MTPLQGEPPKLDFKLPRKLKRWLVALRQFCIETQPLNGSGLSVSQTVKGRLFRTAPADVVASSASSAVHPLKLTPATDAGVAKVRVRLGNTAGRIASAGMTAGTDDPPLLRILTGDGVRYIYAEITFAYSTTTGVWSSTASAIREGASVPANTATLMHFEIGHATRESDGAGGYRVAGGSIHQEVSGSQWCARTGNATTYVDANGLQ